MKERFSSFHEALGRGTVDTILKTLPNPLCFTFPRSKVGQDFHSFTWGVHFAINEPGGQFRLGLGSANGGKTRYHGVPNAFAGLQDTWYGEHCQFFFGNYQFWSAFVFTFLISRNDFCRSHLLSIKTRILPLWLPIFQKHRFYDLVFWFFLHRPFGLPEIQIFEGGLSRIRELARNYPKFSLPIFLRTEALPYSTIAGLFFQEAKGFFCLCFLRLPSPPHIPVLCLFW